MKRILTLITLLVLLSGCRQKIVVDNSFVYLEDPSLSSAYNSYLKEIIDGIDTLSYVETTDMDDYAKKMNDLTSKNIKLIISTPTLAEISKEKNANFRNQDIVCMSNSLKTKYLDKNIMQVLSKTNNAGFLLGAIGGHYASRTAQRHVGFIVVDNCDACNKLLAGVEDGFWEEFPEGDIVIASLQNGLSEEECVDKLVEEGISIIFTSVEHQNTGVLNQIIKHNLNNENVNAIVYDNCPRNIGNYTIEITDSKSKETVNEVKNCILFRAYDNAKSNLDYIIRTYNAGFFENGIFTPYEAGFNVETVNDKSDLNKDSFDTLLSKYIKALNSHEIIVRSSPSNPSVESRVKVIA